MDAFRLQMVYELSVGDLQPIVEKSSSISDHNEEVKLPQAERTICATQDQESNAESLGCDIDAADDEDDSYAEAENDTDCNSDTDGDHNAGVSQDFLVPDFRNAPDPDDIFALRWGKSFYMKNFPHFKRKTLEATEIQDDLPAKKICGPITEKVTAESMQCQTNDVIELDVIEPPVVPSQLEFIETAEPEVVSATSADLGRVVQAAQGCWATLRQLYLEGNISAQVDGPISMALIQQHT
ncbi:hypothetical protein EMCRGX_G007497 [Ephydatia muelleri]